MGQAAELLEVQPAFLRSLDAAGVVTPHRSGGGHRRYSRRQLATAARMRALFDDGLNLDAAARIVALQDQLQAARARIADLERRLAGSTGRRGHGLRTHLHGWPRPGEPGRSVSTRRPRHGGTWQGRRCSGRDVQVRAIEHRRDALAAADAHRHQRVAATGAVQLVDRLDRQHRAGRADG
jgi:DNA-binding transcriptional MerR regulator